MIFLTSLSWIDVFSKSDEKRSLTRIYLTCSPLQGAVLEATSRRPGSLGFPGNSSSRDAPSSNRCLLRTGALLCSALDRWRLSGEFCRTPSKTAKVLPSCSSDWAGVVVSWFQASLPWLMFWWRNLRAPSTGASYHTGASSQRSRSVPRPVVLNVLALLSWRCRPSR